MDEWSSVYNSISAEHNSHLEDMWRILSFSYHDLPSMLKPCLLYLSLFPEDHKVEKDDLIWRWIGEGLVHEKHDRSLYKVGEDYFNDLINRSLVQPVDVDDHGRVQACRVHDIVLEYITTLSLEENLVTINGPDTQHLSNKVRRLSLRNDEENAISQEAKSCLFHVRSLCVFCHAADLKLPFSSFQVLRVLDLEDCSGQNIGHICNLVHLRYLRLGGAHCVEIPKQIGNLQFLQTLDLKQTKTKALPSTLIQLRRLVRLCVDRKTMLPEGIGSMLSLEELSEVDISKHPNLMEELGKLCKLRVLDMSIDTWDRRQREPLLKCLCNLKELQTLRICAADVSLDFMLGNDWCWTPPHLQRLTAGIGRQIEHIFSLNPSSVWSEFSPFSRLPNWIKPALNNLSELSIVVNTLPRKDLEVLGALPALYSLDLHIVKACVKQRMEIFDKSTDNAVQFRCLANFKLVSRASGLVFREHAMQRLRVLSLSFSIAETKYVHGDFYLGLDKLTSLKAVDIGIDCRCATPWEVRHAEVAIRDSINSNPSHPILDLRRHFERDNPWDITREIPELEIIMQELAEVAILGPWGGNRARLHGINVAPHHLRSVIIRSGMVIDSLAFTYCDHNGQQETAGPWGGSGGREHTIYLDTGEFLCNISGTIGVFGSLPNVVTSLTFTTNICSHGPFGVRRGHPFDIPMQRNGRIVGFFAHAGWYVDAIGVYVNLTEEEDGLAKFGPWGGDGVRSHDIVVAPHRLESVTICSCFVIDSLAFSYIDRNGQCRTSGRWGGPGGASNTISLGPSEFLTGISGTIGQYEEHSNVITSLRLVTNARSYGPFGETKGTPFHIPLQSNGCIVGFFGRADKFLNAIGVYTNHKIEIMQQLQAGLVRIGPWGGDGGMCHDIDAAPHHLESVTICSCLVIDSIAFSFRDHKGQKHYAGPWGGCGGNDHKIQLEPSETVVKLSGTIGAFGGIPNVVTSLTLVTSSGRYGPYGREEGIAFHVPARSNGSIVGFFAQAEEYITAIGVYVSTQ
ncbi:unnamed protein product [Urochloa decumbens]